MNTEHFVAIQSLCTHYEVEQSLFNHMMEFGLIEVTLEDETPYLPVDQVCEVEKIIRMYHDLQVNMEGIDVVFNLLHKIADLRSELAATKSRLRLYEG